MKVYKIFDKEFASFNEVIKWAWNEHKIEFVEFESELTEEDKQQACEDLTTLFGWEAA